MRKLTQEEFEERVKWNAPNLKVNGKYQNNRSEIAVECTICGYSWAPKAQSIMDDKKENKVYCPSCNGVLHKTYSDILELISSKSDDVAILECNTPIGNKDNFTVVNLKCGHSWDTTYNQTQSQGIGCPYCAGKKVLAGFNDIATTAPWMVELLKNKEDSFKYTKGSNKKIDWLCTCGKVVKSKAPNDVFQHGLACPNCSDGISYPEKFVGNMLFKLGEEYVTQFTIEGYSYKYDFYLPHYNCIIETHGSQHYENHGFGIIGGKARSLEEEQKNDKIKQNVAIDNGYKYVVLDCRKSELNYIKQSILSSDLSTMIELIQNLNWEDIHIASLKSKLLQICKQYNQNISIEEICRMHGISRNSCMNYLRKGTKSNLCNYSGENNQIQALKISHENTKKPIRCITTNEIFDSLTSAVEKYGFSISLLSGHLNGRSRKAGTDPITKQDLIWEYV